VPSMAVLPAKHRLATKKQISLKDLDGERMVMLSQHSFVRYQLDEAFSSLGVAPNVRHPDPPGILNGTSHQ